MTDRPASVDPSAVTARVIETVAGLVAELRRSPERVTVSPEDALERDLDIHSLERLELLLRLERALGVRLDEAVVLAAERPADLAAAILRPRSTAPSPASSPTSSRQTAGDLLRPAPGSLLFTLYVAILLVLTTPLLRLALLVCPAGAASERLIRWYARRVFRACGCPLRVVGIEHLRDRGPIVLVTNHTSYLDGFALVAALPIDFRLVVKRGLARYPVVGSALRQFRHLIVDRASPTGRVMAAQRMLEALKEGDSLLVFPEATFSRAAAMLPFRLGAFRAAAESGRPVVPIVIRGTRDIMHDRRWLLRRGAIDITIGRPIETAAGGWCESLRLRREARAIIERQLAIEGPRP